MPERKEMLEPALLLGHVCVHVVVVCKREATNYKRDLVSNPVRRLSKKKELTVPKQKQDF